MATQSTRLHDEPVSNRGATAKAGLNTGSEAMTRSTDEAKQGIEEMTAQTEVALRKSQQNFEAAADAGGVMMQGAQEISMAWMNLAQARAQRLAAGFRNLVTCRSPADLIRAQSELLQSGLEQVIDTNRRVADVSMRTMQDVAEKMTAQRGAWAPRDRANGQPSTRV